MFKKTVGSLIVVSALTIGLGAGVSAASQWNNSTIDQEQNHSGWSKMEQRQGKSINDTQSEFAGSKGAASGQSVFVKGYQVQSGKSEGAATATQKEERTFDVGDIQGGTTTTTTGSGKAEQSTTTTGPAHVLQARNTTNAVAHFQGSIKGGPTIQGQILQTHDFQFSTVISR